MPFGYYLIPITPAYATTPANCLAIGILEKSMFRTSSVLFGRKRIRLTSTQTQRDT